MHTFTAFVSIPDRLVAFAKVVLLANVIFAHSEPTVLEAVHHSRRAPVRTVLAFAASLA